MISDSMPHLPADPAGRASPTPARRLAGLLVAALLMTALPLTALESDRHQDMTIESDSSDSDIERGVVRLSGNVTIEQGSLRIEAGSGEIHQDRNSGEIARVLLEGAPARMQQALDNAAGQMRASARRIDYDAARDTVVLSGDVRIVEPRGTMTGQQISYDIARGSIRGQSGAGEGDRVRLILPGRRPAPAAPEPPTNSPGDPESTVPAGDPDNDGELSGASATELVPETGPDDTDDTDDTDDDTR